MSAAWIECPDCDGRGGWVAFIGCPGEPHERLCDSCDGEGGWFDPYEVTCPDCEGEVDDENDFGTEVVSDPLKHIEPRRAA